jgi:D-lactate dehydrogenase (cytochrome)
MRDNVLNLTIVMPDGEIIKTRQRAKKCSAGPDFGRYFIGALPVLHARHLNAPAGSEGTLGIVTEATLKLAPILPYSVGVSSSLQSKRPHHACAIWSSKASTCSASSCLTT